MALRVAIAKFLQEPRETVVNIVNCQIFSQVLIRADTHNLFSWSAGRINIVFPLVAAKYRIEFFEI